jgi:hypothetical protein
MSEINIEGLKENLQYLLDNQHKLYKTQMYIVEQLMTGAQIKDFTVFLDELYGGELEEQAQEKIKKMAELLKEKHKNEL